MLAEPARRCETASRAGTAAAAAQWTTLRCICQIANTANTLPTPNR
jgi:hypothetical protein